MVTSLRTGALALLYRYALRRFGSCFLRFALREIRA